MHDCHLLHVYTPKEVEELFIIGNSKGWRIWNSLPAPAKHFFNRTFWYGTAEAKQMLLYAERQYLNTHFRNYDPARQDMWAEENRPWDFDHIVPQEWISNKRGNSETMTKTGFGVLEIWQQSPLRRIEAKAMQTNIPNITTTKKHFFICQKLNHSTQTLPIIMKTVFDLQSLHMNDTA